MVSLNSSILFFFFFRVCVLMTEDSNKDNDLSVFLTVRGKFCHDEESHVVCCCRFL